MTQDEKTEIVKTHYAVIATVLKDEDKAVDFLAWSAKFFSENPDVLRQISNPKTRDKVFSTAAGMMNNPIIRQMF